MWRTLNEQKVYATFFTEPHLLLIYLLLHMLAITTVTTIV
jgi:hypothetical protein